MTVPHVPTDSAPRLIDPDRLRASLGDDADHFALDLRAQCTSTNTELRDAPPPADGRVPVLACELQSAGRGRRGRSWQAWPGASLTFSSLWRFAPGAPVPAGLSLVAGLAVAEALEALGVAGVELKWPNDIQVGGDKLGGILVELSGARAVAAVVGTGLNLSLPPGAQVPGRRDVTALERLLDPAPPAHLVLAAILRAQRRLFGRYAESGFPAFVDAWNRRNAHAGKAVRVGDESDAVEGQCLGVDVDGALRLRTATGVQRVLAGDLSLRSVA